MGFICVRIKDSRLFNYIFAIFSLLQDYILLGDVVHPCRCVLQLVDNSSVFHQSKGFSVSKFYRCFEF